jgi:hypothetical protein
MLSYTATKTETAELLAAPGAGKFYRVLGYQIMGSDSEATIQLRSATTPKATVLTPATGVGGISCPPGKEPYFDCAANEALNLNTGGGTALTLAINVQYAILGAL